VLAKVRAAVPIEKKISRDVFGPCPPSVFVGDYGWPNVSVGPLVSVNDSLNPAALDDPSKWFGCSYSEIIEFRSSLARGMKMQHVKARNRVLADLQESVLSTAPVDFEVRFKNVPKLNLSFSSMLAPMGPSGEMENMRVASAAKIPRKVDSVVNEGLKVAEAMPELVKSGFDYYYLQKLLCSGLLGREAEKKVVSTRWSITATDLLLANQFLKEVREFPEINDYRIYSSEFLYNHFEVLLLPGKWEFEQFEAWDAGSIWTVGENRVSISEEFEPFWGRTKYADKQAGGFYAARFGAVEALRDLGRQARVVVFREIGSEYRVPCGVFEIRENVRHAFKNPPEKFASLQEAFAALRLRLKNPLESYLEQSVLLRQRRLNEF
jgi:DNA repair protein NreA